MTRKDFVLIASTVASLPVNKETRKAIARDFAIALETTNPAFDRDRFVTACMDGTDIGNKV